MRKAGTSKNLIFEIKILLFYVCFKEITFGKIRTLLDFLIIMFILNRMEGEGCKKGFLHFCLLLGVWGKGATFSRSPQQTSHRLGLGHTHTQTSSWQRETALQ